MRPERTGSSCLPLSCPKGEPSEGSSNSSITLQEEGTSLISTVACNQKKAVRSLEQRQGADMA